MKQLLAALIFIAALVWWLLRDPEPSGTDAAAAEAAADAEAATHQESSGEGSTVSPRRTDAGSDALVRAPTPTAEANTPEPTAPVDPELAAADEYRRRIQEALQNRVASASSEDGREFSGRLDPQYIRDAVREIRPLLAECYEMAQQAAESAGEPVPEGQLITEFTIVGAEGEGGIVETSSIDESSELFHPVLDECFRETLYTLELPAPEEGGRILVRYPFHLSNTDP